jgi:hypothetical protein
MKVWNKVIVVTGGGFPPPAESAAGGKFYLKADAVASGSMRLPGSTQPYLTAQEENL